MTASITDVVSTVQNGVQAASRLGKQVVNQFGVNAAEIAANTTAIAANAAAITLLQNNRFGSIVLRTFTSNGTYTPTVGMIYCVIETLGAGGGGGGVAITAAGTTNGAGGGGSGGLSRKVASAATIGVSQVVTIGAGGPGGTAGNNPGTNGGDTSLGALCVGKGGTGGSGAASGASGAGGAGGVVGTGDVTLAGSPGLAGFRATSITVVPTTISGGASIYGQGGTQQPNTTTAATGFGAGGAGASDFNGTGNQAGSAGAGGLILITEYCVT